jgi:hypothetical protein
VLVHKTGASVEKTLLDLILISIKKMRTSNESTVKAKSKKLGVKLPRGSIHVRKTSLVSVFFFCD